MSKPDIRWQQRLQNFIAALAQLSRAVQLNNQRALSELERQGLIQTFEFTHELAWNVMKDYFRYQGNNLITGSRDATRESFQTGLIQDGESWMDMIASRNKSSHTYNEKVATEICDKVTGTYFALFQNFKDKMEELKLK